MKNASRGWQAGWILAGALFLGPWAATAQAGTVRGVVRDAATSAPLAGVSVQIYDAAGNFAASGSTDAAGVYLTSPSLPTGTYFARTFNGNGYVDELFDNLFCPSCSLTSGTPIPVTAGLTTSGIDFGLARGGRVAGRVTDAATSLALSGPSVSLYDAGGRFVSSGATDASGNYLTGSGLPTGTYFAKSFNFSGYVDEVFDNISCPGCDVTTGTPIAVTAGATVSGINFALALGGRVSGHVTDAATSAPLVNVNVQLYDTTGRFATSGFTDATGAYLTSSGLPAGTYFARTFNSSGYLEELFNNLPCSSSCTVTSGTPIAVTVGATTPGIDFGLARGGRITGRLVNAATSAPLPGVQVRVYDGSGRNVTSGQTDLAGLYVSSSGLPAGSYFVRTANTLGYVDEVFDNIPCPGCTVTSGTPVGVVAGGTTSGVDFALAAGGRIAGRVTDAVSASALVGVEVEVFDSGGRFVGSSFTDAAGQYVLGTGLPTGTYFVRTFNSLGYVDELYNNIACVNCTVTSGTPVPVTAGTTISGIDFGLARGGQITGRVTDAATATPLAGVSVQVYDSTGRFLASRSTDALGVYRSVGLPAGSYFALTFNSLGYVNELYNNLTCVNCTVTTGTAIAVAAGGTTSGIDFTLARGGRVAGRVTDAATSAGLPGASVDLYDSAGHFATSGFTDASGNYLTDGGVPSGTYFAVTFNSAGYVDELFDNLPCVGGNCTITAGTPITVSAGSTTAGINFALGVGGRISGHVTAVATGMPLANLEVEVLDSTGRFLTDGFTDGTGAYLTGSGLPTGSYFVRTFNSLGYVDELFDNRPCPPCTTSTGTPVGVTAGSTTGAVDFALALGGRISGRVTDATTGLPLSGVSVQVYNATGQFVTSRTSDSTGAYLITTGLAAGSYFVRTSNSLAYIDELFDNIPCLNCTVTTGTPVAVSAGSTTSGIDFALLRGGRISGRVTDAVTAAPVAGVTVSIYDNAARFITSRTTDATGNYLTTTGLPAGNYFARTTNSVGYVDELFDNIVCSSCSPTTGTAIPVTLGSTTANINFALTLGGRISGRVTDTASGLPLSGVTVQIYDAALQFITSRTTDATGAYVTTQGLLTGTYFARTSNTLGYINELFDNIPCTSCNPSSGTPIAVTAGSTTPGIDFALAVGGRFAGRVTDAGTGLPLANVSVQFYDASGRSFASGFTDATGSYTSSGLLAGSYFARTFNSLGYVDELYNDIPCLSCTVTTGTPIAVTVGSTTSGIDFALAPGGRIRGRVTDAVTGTPLTGVSVQVVDVGGRFVTSGTTDATGNYTSPTGLITGTYFVRTFNSLGYVDELFDNIACAGCNAAGGTPVPVTLGATTSGIDFALAVGGRIRGVVTAAGSGTPLNGVLVEIFRADGAFVTSDTTDAAGVYLSGAGLLSGSYFVHTSNTAGYVDEVFDNIVCPECDVTTGTPVPVSVGATTTGIDFVLDPGSTISGRVTDAVSGLPLSNVSVSILDALGRTVGFGSSDTTGAYRTNAGLPSGTYFARTSNTQAYIDELWDNVVCLNCNPGLGAPIVVGAPAPVTGIDFALRTGGRFSGRVLETGTGRPLFRVNVQVVDVGGRTVASAVTDSTGVYLIGRGLPTGQYYARTTNPLGYVNKVYNNRACCNARLGNAIAVTEGAITPNIDFSLALGGTIRGTITDDLTAAPLSGVGVSIYDSTGRFVASGGTDSRGLYLTDGGLPAGSYFAHTVNTRGYLNELFAGINCPTCSPGQGPSTVALTGTPIAVTVGSATGGIDFSLSRGGTFSGRVLDALTSRAVQGVTVQVYDAAGTALLTSTTSPSGTYTIAGGLSPGTYFARTLRGSGYESQLFGGTACPLDCDPTTGTAIVVSLGATTTGIDFNVVRARAGQDFNADGHDDLLWNNQATRQNLVWLVQASTVLSQGSLPAAPDANWKVVGTADFDGDGQADVLWRNGATGDNALWFIDDTTLRSAAVLTRVADVNWRIVGVGDFDGDRMADVFWRNAATGDNAVWLMNGSTLRSSVLLTRVPDLNITVAGVADVDGNGKADVLFHNVVTGANGLWIMDGTTVLSTPVLPRLADVNWQVMGFADFDGDHRADIFWRHAGTGANGLWRLNGATVLSTPALPSIPVVGWAMEEVADLSGDGKADVVWRQAAGGNNLLWVMDGASVTAALFLPAIADLNWMTVP